MDYKTAEEGVGEMAKFSVGYGVCANPGQPGGNAYHSAG